MLYGSDLNGDNEIKEFRQRVADQNIQSLMSRQDEIEHAKKGFIGMLAGIVVGGVVGWLFFGLANNQNSIPEIPVIRRSLLPPKVQPNEPGGMDINNQNREIYHIVDNIPQEKKEINIIETPEMPKIVTENTIEIPENMESLVESIEEENNLEDMASQIKDVPEEKIKVANRELSAIKTNSNDKIIIPQKLKDIDVKVQNTVNSQKQTINEKKEEPKHDIKITTPDVQPQQKSAKGTWYAQIIASSSYKAVENLWQQLSAKHSFIKTYSHEIEEITAANGNTLYRLKVGAFKTRQEAEKLSEQLKQNKISSIIKQN